MTKATNREKLDIRVRKDTYTCYSDKFGKIVFCNNLRSRLNTPSELATLGKVCQMES